MHFHNNLTDLNITKYTKYNSIDNKMFINYCEISLHFKNIKFKAEKKEKSNRNAFVNENYI